MKALIVALLFVLNYSTVHGQELAAPLAVVHTRPTGKFLTDPPFRHMYYYRTEVRNTSDRPLKIVWFEVYQEINGVWRASNVLGRTLRGADFAAWYTEGATVRGGVIQPGDTAACDANWHGGDSLGPMRVKWAFIAVDAAGNDYYVEAVVDPSIVKAVEAW
jgi:hypothetical protein